MLTFFRQFPSELGFKLALGLMVLLVLSQLGPGRPVFGPGPELELALVVAAIALAGLPHGAADAWIAAREGLAGNSLRTAAFLAGYTAAAMLVVGAWLVVPVLSLTLFLSISVWHFGDDSRQGLHPLARISTGLIILGAPAVFHAAAVSDAYRVLAGDQTAAIVAVQGVLFWLACLVLPLTLALTPAKVPLVERASRGRIKHLVEMIVLTALAALLSPLLYFAVYFCGIHSPRHLGRVMRLFPERGGLKFWGTVLALTLVSILVGAAAWAWLTTSGQRPEAAGLKVLFIGLAALTLPHMLLVDGLSPTLLRGKAQ